MFVLTCVYVHATAHMLVNTKVQFEADGAARIQVGLNNKN